MKNKGEAKKKNQNQNTSKMNIKMELYKILELQNK